MSTHSLTELETQILPYFKALLLLLDGAILFGVYLVCAKSYPFVYLISFLVPIFGLPDLDSTHWHINTWDLAIDMLDIKCEELTLMLSYYTFRSWRK